MNPLPVRKIEFIAQTLTDVGKGVLVVGVASYFFEKFPFTWRVGFGFMSVILMITGIVLYPERGESD